MSSSSTSTIVHHPAEPPPPPPVPPTPPSRGRILALKCYTKAKNSLSKGLSRSKNKNKNKDIRDLQSPTEENKHDLLEELAFHVSSTSSTSSASSVGEPPSDLDDDDDSYERIEYGGPTPTPPRTTTFTTNASPWTTEEDYEDDDSSKWTLSAPSSAEDHHNYLPHHPEIDEDIFSPDQSEATSPPPPPAQPPMSPDVPCFPSSSSSSADSSSSSDSFASCASNPEELEIIKKKVSLPSPSKRFVWGRRVLPPVLIPIDGDEEEVQKPEEMKPVPEEDKAIHHQVDESVAKPEVAQDIEEPKLESDGEIAKNEQEVDADDNDATEKDVLLLLESEDEQDDLSHSDALPLPPSWGEERPETGPGEEHHYQNVVTLPTQEIHRVLHNVPPRVMEAVRERRRRSSVEDETHGRSARMSRLLQKELKTLDQPGVGVTLIPPRVRRWRIGKKSSFEVPNLDSDDPDHAPSSKKSSKDDTHQGGSEFEDLRRLVKSGGDFCKDLAVVLHERSELESTYAKGLSKLSAKLLKASKEAKGSVAHAWQAVAVQIDTQAELHRQWSSSLEDELAKPLRTSTDTQHKIRKSVEVLVDKTTRNLADWRLAEAKSKRHCFSSSKEFEKLQQHDASVANSGGGGGPLSSNNRLNAEGRPRSRLLNVPPTDKDPIKLESKRRKAEENVRRGDVDYYTFCIRSERARLEWEGAIRNGSTCLRTLEEEKLSLLKEMASKYLHHLSEFTPRWIHSIESLTEPINASSVSDDLASVADIRRHVGAEQLLPDFYAEDSSNLMNKARRREVLEKCLYLITQDLEREKKGAVGVENLAKAVADTPTPDNAHHDIADKLYYLRSMLLYLEAARAKVDNVMADVESRPRSNYPISQYMRHQRDKQGLPQTILKVPSWAREECLALSPVIIPSPTTNNWSSSSISSIPHQRGKADGTSAHLEEEDEICGGGESNLKEVESVQVVMPSMTRSPTSPGSGDGPSIGKCRAIYDYEANLFDELSIRVGEEINIHDKQEDGWWLGELHGAIGIFPATYVEEIVSSP